MRNKILQDILFWMHIGGILLGVFLGLLVSLPLLLLLVVLHRFHVALFHGCLFTRLQRRLGVLPVNMSFLQFVVLRLFGKRINARQSSRLDYGLVLFSLNVAVLHSL